MPALMLQSVLQASALRCGEIDLAGRTSWRDFMRHEGKEEGKCLLCFTFASYGNF